MGFELIDTKAFRRRVYQNYLDGWKAIGRRDYPWMTEQELENWATMKMLKGARKAK